MRVLFLIPKNNPPQLTGNYTKQFKEFVEACLNKEPENVSVYRYIYVRGLGSLTDNVDSEISLLFPLNHSTYPNHVIANYRNTQLKETKSLKKI